MWGRRLDERTLTFRLIGINNQNFLMEDLQTGSWWQQVTGAAISGPLKGRRLTPVLHDEMSFGLWRREHPGTRVLAMKGKRPDDEIAAVPPEWQVTDIQPLKVPGLDEERTIVVCGLKA